MITAVITSDNHLGAYYARLRPERLEKRRRALQEAFRRVVDEAIKRRADLFLHAGDLFDRPDPRNAERRFVAEQIQRLRDAGILVFAVAGNHDSPRSMGYDGGVTPHEAMEALGAVRLFRRVDAWDAEIVEVRGQKVRVRGLSYDPALPDDACPLAVLAPLDERPEGLAADFALLHYGVEGWGDFPQEACLSLANLRQLKADVVGIGHLHRPNSKQMGDGPLLLNPGATEHISFGEEALSCGFYVVCCEPGRALEAEYVSLPTQPMRTLVIDMEELARATPAAPAEDTEDTEDAVEPEEVELSVRAMERIGAVSRAEQLLRVRLKGRLARSRFPELDVAALQEFGGGHNFHCQFDTSDLALYDELADLHVDIGFSFDVRQELQATADAMRPRFAEDAHQLEITRLAAETVEAAFESLTGGAR